MWRYRAYLLRLWQAKGDDGRPVWRAALEDARTGERHGFADRTWLCACLKNKLRAGLNVTRIHQKVSRDVSRRIAQTTLIVHRRRCARRNPSCYHPDFMWSGGSTRWYQTTSRIAGAASPDVYSSCD
jgi:hypothetical protein